MKMEKTIKNVAVINFILTILIYFLNLIKYDLFGDVLVSMLLLYIPLILLIVIAILFFIKRVNKKNLIVPILLVMLCLVVGYLFYFNFFSLHPGN